MSIYGIVLIPEVCQENGQLDAIDKWFVPLLLSAPASLFS